MLNIPNEILLLPDSDESSSMIIKDFQLTLCADSQPTVPGNEMGSKSDTTRVFSSKLSHDSSSLFPIFKGKMNHLPDETLLRRP